MKIKKTVKAGVMLATALIAGLIMFPAATLNAAGDVKINADNFPDANFRDYIKGYDYNNNGKLSSTEMSNVTYIYVANRAIKSLKGIEKFTNLQTLYCQNNQLTSLDLSKNTKITYLNCGSNQISSIKGLSGLKNLNTLNISSNKFTSISGLSNLKNLSYLYCSNNNIKSLDLSSNTNLYYVDAQTNAITSVKGGNMLTQLAYLYISENKLTSLDLSKCPALSYLTCSDNQISSLKVPEDTIRYLICANNKLKTFNAGDLTLLTHLNVSGNPLTKITIDNPVLNTLYCSNIGLTSLDVSGAPALQVLSCSGNKLKTLDFTKNKLISQLSCYNNQLTSIEFSKTDAMTILLCDRNKLTDLDVSGMKKLILLSCYDNQIKKLDARNSLDLTIICAQNNKFDYAHISVAAKAQTYIYANLPENLIESASERMPAGESTVPVKELVKAVKEGTSSGGSVGGGSNTIGTATFKSANTKIVQVTGQQSGGYYEGLVKGISAGAATVKATVDGKETKYKVHVLYTDVTDLKDYWFEPTRELTEKGVVKGYANQTEFRPANDCSRAQMLTFLYRLQGEPKTKSSTCKFQDVKSSDYFFKPVIWAVEQGITTVPSDKKFNPQTVCTRAMTVTFLWRMAGKPEPKTTKNPFPDVEKTDYFYKATLWASEMKILAGFPDGTFKPQGKCLRRQMVTFLYKYDKFVNK
ncbi:MAG: leucine-rich repeat domain-containing protein [Saccharofermentans sp.]|nr:leucine-rich repeat domain-containing protein [Saccharofermentans sp.]